MKNKFLIMIVILTIILASCSENTLNENSKSNSEKDLLGMILNQIDIPDNLYYQFYVYKAKQSLLINANDTVYSIQDSAFQNFYNAYLFDNAGTVSIAGYNLTHSSNGTYNNFVNNIDLDGNNKEYIVQGGGDVPAFSFELENPLSFASILSPGHGSTQDNDNIMTVTWTSEPTKNMTVVLSILSNEADSAYVGIYDKVLPDNGSYTFQPSDLQQFKTGIVMILLRRGNYTFDEAPNGKQYGAFTFSQDAVCINLTD